jgi:hypothetical protein
MRTVAIQCTDNLMVERGVLLTSTYSTHEFDDGRIAIRAAMSTSIGYHDMIWLPVFTEWFDA